MSAASVDPAERRKRSGIALAIDNSVGDVALIPWRVRVAPVNVTSVGSAGCNPYENRVCYASLWEDNRCDGDTILETYVRPEPAGGCVWRTDPSPGLG